MIESQEPNKLKAEIYRLRYEHQKLDQAKSLLGSQQTEIERIKKYRTDLQNHMAQFKQDEEQKRQELNAQINDQRRQIKEKEAQIKVKNDAILSMEKDYEERMNELRK